MIVNAYSVKFICALSRRNRYVLFEFHVRKDRLFKLIQILCSTEGLTDGGNYGIQELCCICDKH
jgi:hypothetical protein